MMFLYKPGKEERDFCKITLSLNLLILIFSINICDERFAFSFFAILSIYPVLKKRLNHQVLVILQISRSKLMPLK